MQASLDASYSPADSAPGLASAASLTCASAPNARPASTWSRRELWLAGFGLLCVGAAWIPLPGVTAYADAQVFADQTQWLGLSHALDVLSNVPFALLGVLGLRELVCRDDEALSPVAALFFGGLVVTAIASAVYHLEPDRLGLLYDRSAMITSFAGMLGLAAGSRVSNRAGSWTAGLGLIAGALALTAWWLQGWFEPWVIFQFGGMALILALALCRPLAGTRPLALWAVIAWYGAAKLCEWGDHSIAHWTHDWITGHSLKHVLAAMAAWPVLQAWAVDKP